MTFSLFCMGLEQAGWRKLLNEVAWWDQGVSYWGLRRRLPKTKPWVMSEHFHDNANVFLDSGGHSLAKAQLTVGEIEDYDVAYRAFVELNADRLTMVSEVDARALGPKWIQERRGWYEDTVGDRFLPVWHLDDGERELDRLASSYERVGVHESALEQHGNLAARVNGMAAKYGTAFHCMASAKPDDLRAVHFASAATSSWLSPMKYGETFVWTGTALARYPATMKDQARRRHRTLFEREGFDVEALEADDPGEISRLTLWSLRQMALNVELKRPRDGQVVDLSVIRGERVDAEDDQADVGSTAVEVRKSPAALVQPRDPSERSALPVMGFEAVSSRTMGDDGVLVLEERSEARLAGRSARVCDSCYLQAQCPAMKPGADCAYDLPIQLETKDQLQAALRATLEMQVQRVAFMRFAEELQGGYADPNLSSELDRLYRMTTQLKEIEASTNSIKIEAKGNAGAGVLSAIFGDRAGELRKLDAPLDAGQTNRLVAGVLESPVRPNRR